MSLAEARWTHCYHYSNRFGEPRIVQSRWGLDGRQRLPSGAWLDLVETVARACGLPYVQLLRNPFFQTMDALRRLLLTSIYVEAPPPPALKVIERRFRLPGNATRIRERSVLARLSGWVSCLPPPDPAGAAPPAVAPASLSLQSDYCWPSPGRLRRPREEGGDPDPEEGGTSDVPPAKRLRPELPGLFVPPCAPLEGPSSVPAPPRHGSECWSEALGSNTAAGSSSAPSPPAGPASPRPLPSPRRGLPPQPSPWAALVPPRRPSVEA